MNAAIRQYKAIQALANHADQCREVERGWSQRDIATSQMEMSLNGTMEREIRIIEGAAVVISIAIAAAGTTWLAMGGIDMIRGWLA